MIDSTLNKYSQIIKITDLIDCYDLFLFDLWGVLINGQNSCYSGSVESVNNIIAQHKKLIFVSNSSRTSLSIYEKLKAFGVNLTNDMVITAGELTKNILFSPNKYFDIAQPIIYNFGRQVSQELWTGSNVKSTEDINQANLMLIAFNAFADEINDSSYDILRQAASLKIPAICPNNDRIVFLDDKIMYCPGHFAKKFEEFGGQVSYIGKPFKPIFQEALDRYPAIDKSRILMVGDSLDTDIIGANNMQIHSALVTTGNVELQLLNQSTDSQKLLHIRQICTNNNVYPNYIVSL